MAIRKQWTEWHLTPEGWVSGSSRRDGEGTVWRDEPAERVITYVYQELDNPDLRASVEESWRSKTADNIEQLLVQCGPCPERL